MRVGLRHPAAKLGRLSAAQVQDGPHSPGLRAGDRDAHSFGALETEFAGLERFFVVAEVPQDDREIRGRADARVALRFVYVVRPRRLVVWTGGLAHVLACEVELPEIHVREPAVGMCLLELRRVA